MRFKIRLRLIVLVYRERGRVDSSDVPSQMTNKKAVAVWRVGEAEAGLRSVLEALEGHGRHGHDGLYRLCRDWGITGIKASWYYSIMTRGAKVSLYRPMTRSEFNENRLVFD